MPRSTLSQADVHQAIGAVISAKPYIFTIRVYGGVINPLDCNTAPNAPAHQLPAIGFLSLADRPDDKALPSANEEIGR